MAGLYIHIPFCAAKCSYCDFYSMPLRGQTDVYIDAVLCEYNARCHEISEPFHTLYIGGGTPSLLPDNLIAELVSKLCLDNIEEFTIEVNPDDVTPERVKVWKEIGVNRVSMGIQSFEDAQLSAIGRRHTANQARKAIDDIIDGGIENISCDLIYGLPGQTLASWINSLQQLLNYHIPHISAYCLSYEPGTRLHAAMTTGRVIPTDDLVLEQMYDHLCTAAADAGYEHYEISNFSLPGYKSRHNSSYWDSTPYLGLGPGAHSFDGVNRRYNRTDLKKYLMSPVGFTSLDCENDTERYNDKLITTLRTSDGLDLNSLTDIQRNDLILSATPRIERGDLNLIDNRLTITEKSWFISDAILRDLICV